MNKAYNRINWENYPSIQTPLNEQNLNKMDGSVDEIDNRVITLDTTKATKTEVAPLITEISFNESNGVFTITRKNGSKFTIDTKLEKIAINFGYDKVTQKISLTLIDGTVQYIDLSALITQYEFMDTDTVSFFVDTNEKVSAIVKDGSITEDKLQPNYLAKIKVEAAKAEAAATAADASKTAAAASATTATNKANSAATSATNAANSATAADASKTAAAASATTATNKAGEAATSATNAANSKTAAATSATNAANSASTATTKANAASAAATAAASSATSADTYAKQAQSYAVGMGGVRPNESTDNAKYYYEQSRSISEGLAGVLQPMGTVTFANLPLLANVESGWMYNVSDEFVTDSTFKEGAGRVIPAGSNVYKTADGFWDILTGTPVTKVNGQTGIVTVNLGNIEGTLPISKGGTGATTATNGLNNLTAGASVESETYQFSDNDSVLWMYTSGTGGTYKTKFAKLWNYVKGKLATVATSGSYNDLSNKPAIPSVGNGTVTIKQAGTSKGSFTMNQSGNVEINLTDNNTTYGVVSKTDAGLAPQLPNETATTKYLRQDGTWSVPPDTNTTYGNMTAATASVAGKAGLVPAPAAGAQSKVLKGNATWDSIENLTNAFSQATSRANLASGETLKVSLGKIMKWFSDLTNGAASTLLGGNLTASRALVSNTSGKIDVSAVTSTELGYLDGATSNIQSQLNELYTGLKNKVITKDVNFTVPTLNGGSWTDNIVVPCEIEGYTAIGFAGYSLTGLYVMMQGYVNGNKLTLQFYNPRTNTLEGRVGGAKVIYLAK